MPAVSRIFLSTPSARRATDSLNISFCKLHISIHALREEGDGEYYTGLDGSGVFLSTPSARRATEMLSDWMLTMLISIHALREEGDL